MDPKEYPTWKSPPYLHSCLHARDNRECACPREAILRRGEQKNKRHRKYGSGCAIVFRFTGLYNPQWHRRLTYSFYSLFAVALATGSLLLYRLPI
jgi:hypothetical protein